MPYYYWKRIKPKDGGTPEGVAHPNRFWQPYEEATIKDVILLLIYYRLSQTPKGMDVLKEIMKGVFDTTQALAQASGSNSISAWGNPVLLSEIFNRFGFVNPAFVGNYHLGLSLISGVEQAEDFVKIVADALPWNLLTKPAPAEFPAQIVYSAREAGIEVPEKIGWKELMELMIKVGKVGKKK